VAALGDGADKMRNSRMIQRLAPTNPNNCSSALRDALHFFAGNWRRGPGMKNFRWLNKPDESTRRLRPENSRDSALHQFCKERRGQAHHAF
jgi:hypothetical protein